MPLRDHFRPPLSERRHWHSFHSAWATFLASALNDRLPDGYFAEPNVQLGIEIDVAAFGERLDVFEGENGRESGGALTWAPPQPTLTVPFAVAGETIEVLVFNREAGPVLAGAVELVSPANKNRPESREAFVSKCETYLHEGIGLAVVDVVTSRRADLHAELLARIHPGAGFDDEGLYAAAYRAVERGGSTELDVWRFPLAIGEALSVVPLWLRGGLCLPVELEAAYERTCREHRIDAA
jgi:hypothetical protein